MESHANTSSFLDVLAGQLLTRMGVGIILTDPDGRIQWVNERQQWFTALPAEGLLGTSIFEHPGLDSAELHEAVQSTLVKGKGRQLILRQPRLNCRIEVSPLSLKGRLLGAAICFYERESTAAKTGMAADESLNQLVADEQRAMVWMLSSLLDAMPCAIAAVTQEGVVLYVNAAWRTTFAADALDRPLSEMLPESARGEVSAALKKCWREGRGQLITESKNGDGAHQYWVAPLPANQELTLGLVVALQELASGANGDQHLFALQMTNICQYTARLVHDIRSPLTTLTCELELLRNENLHQPGGVHKFQSAIDLFSQQVEEINGILGEVEVMGTEESGQLEICQVNEIVKNARFVAEWRRPYRNIHIELLMPEDLPAVYCDGLRLQKGLTGLLMNALDQTGEAGHVTLHVSRLPSGDLGCKLIYSVARTGLNEQLPPHPSWRSANVRLALAYAVIIELGGRFEMRRLRGGETEIKIVLSGYNEPTSRKPVPRPC